MYDRFNQPDAEGTVLKEFHEQVANLIITYDPVKVCQLNSIAAGGDTIFQLLSTSLQFRLAQRCYTDNDFVRYRCTTPGPFTRSRRYSGTVPYPQSIGAGLRNPALPEGRVEVIHLNRKTLAMSSTRT